MTASVYPSPSSAATSLRMSRNPSRDTRPELLVRSALHSLGLRFRVSHPLRLDGLTVRPDVVFTRRRVAVFIDGCFWHSCPIHATTPRRNTDYWLPKLKRNVARDQRVDAALSLAGWRVIRAWEHEPVDSAVRRVVEALDSALAR